MAHISRKPGHLIALLLVALAAAAQTKNIETLLDRLNGATDAGDYQAAASFIPPFIQALDSLPAQSEAAILPWNQIALYYKAVGRNGDAERIFMRIIRQFDKVTPPPSGLEAVHLNLATIYLQTTQRPKLAELHCRRGYELAMTNLGSGNPLLIKFDSMLGAALAQQNRGPEAEVIYRRALDRAERSGDKQEQGHILSNIAILAAARKQWLNAAAHLQRSLDALAQGYGEEHPELALPYLNLSFAQRRLKNWAAAEKAADRAQAITESRFGPTHPMLQHILELQASLHKRAGRGQHARTLLERAKAIALMHPPDSSQSGWVHAADLIR